MLAGFEEDCCPTSLTNVERDLANYYSAAALAHERFGQQPDELVANIVEGFQRLARNSYHEHKRD